MGNNPPNTPLEDTLQSTVRSLKDAVDALREVMANDYPTRVEIKRRRTNIVIGMISAIVASYFVTVGTVSYCFLDGIPEKGSKFYCGIFPGYRASFDDNEAFLRDYIATRNKVAVLESEMNKLNEKG